jgi:RNA polymerase sigma-54 factor
VEDNNAPHSDDKLAEILNEEGIHIARRTVAKYREQLRIPIARLRKSL